MSDHPDSSLTSSQYGSSGASSSTSHQSRPQTHVVVSNLSGGSGNRNAFEDIRNLLDILHDNNIPGPRLIRLDKTSEEFSETVGNGGQSIVQGPSQKFCDKLSHLGGGRKLDNVWHSTQFWRRCVVKQLRHGRPGQSHLGQVEFALNELNILCNKKLKSPNVVRLVGWGLCLDSLEKRSSAPRLPLLILEQARFDLSMFIRDSNEFAKLGFDDVRVLTLNIGQGLEAIHSADLCHGDMKLENILIFENTSSDPRLNEQWIPKICDFGSSTTTKTLSRAQDYYGTNTWLPPERYCKPKMMIDLRRCDMFAYGLVVWATFTRNPDSPMASVDAETIQSEWGMHKAYGMALRNMVELYAQSQLERDETLLRMARSSWIARLIAILIRPPSDDPLSASTTDYGPDLNQVLYVLSVSLNDHPLFRSRRPWIYLRKGAAQLPVLFPQIVKRTAIHATEQVSSFSLLATMRDISAVHIRQSQVRLQHLATHFQEIAAFYIKTWVPILRPGVSKQRMYESFHRVFVHILGHNPDNIHLVDHAPGESCFQLYPEGERRFSSIIKKIHLDTSAPIDPYHHAWYGLARIRSRLPPCCWRKILQSSSCHEIIENALEEVQRFQCDSSLAWALRGKTVTNDSRLLQSDAPCFQLNPSYFDFLATDHFHWKHSHDDSCRTERMLVLLDSDVYIGQPFEPGNPMSVFEAYLRSLTVKKTAILVCRHFRRMASMQDAGPECKLFYLGSLVSVDEDQIGSDASISPQTTTLHDAVRVGCYPVVQYLIRMGFNVAARNSNRQTATDLAILYNDTLERREILDLLMQHPSNRGIKFELPLGWESINFSNSEVGYCETSISSDIHSITFKKPRISLLQDRLIALADRQLETLQGASSEKFYLNPLRFLKSFRYVEPTLTVAKDKEHDDYWFQIEVQRTINSEIKATTDERRWYRVTAKSISFLASLPNLLGRFIYSANVDLFLIFVPLCLASRILNWNAQLGFAFGILSSGILAYKVAFYSYLTSRLLSFEQDYAFEIASLTSLLPTVLLGTLFVGRGDLKFPVLLLVGQICCQSFLVLGSALLVGGLRYSEQTWSLAWSQLISSTGWVAPSLSVLLRSLDTRRNLSGHPVESTILVVSRSGAIFCLFAWLMSHWFRYRTHRHIFEADTYGINFQSENDDRPVQSLPFSFSKKPKDTDQALSAARWSFYTPDTEHNALFWMRRAYRAQPLVLPSLDDDNADPQILLTRLIAQLALSLVSLILVTLILDQAIVEMNPTSQSLIAFFVLPIAASFWLHTQPIRDAYNDRLDRAIEWTTGHSLKMAQLVLPIWILRGWWSDIPMSLQFDMFSTGTFGLSFWLTCIFLRTGRSDFLTGGVMMGTYNFLMLAYFVFIEATT